MQYKFCRKTLKLRIDATFIIFDLRTIFYTQYTRTRTLVIFTAAHFTCLPLHWSVFVARAKDSDREVTVSLCYVGKAIT
jgi:hypothetical protein